MCENFEVVTRPDALAILMVKELQNNFCNQNIHAEQQKSKIVKFWNPSFVMFETLTYFKGKVVLNFDLKKKKLILYYFEL